MQIDYFYYLTLYKGLLQKRLNFYQWNSQKQPEL